MYPQQRQDRFRAWTGNPLVAMVLALLLSAQTAIAMPHAHPADHGSAVTETSAQEMADYPARGHHHTDAAPEKTSGSGQDPESRDCCEIECQDCTMGSCSSLTQSRGAGRFDDSPDKRFSALDTLIPEPMISSLYRPPISR